MAAKEKMVKIKLFKDNDKYKDDVFVAVNGKSYLIKRGAEVEVPESVKEVLDNSAAQEERAAEYMETQQKEYEQKTKKLET
uniref:Uncharacterized protein n=1 Tax=Podoviridae sp. ctZ5d16 TaxID=2825257 RepID=A0A8S5Q9C4_9CAUD|nr:MAG TPA: hypothetical protein [Podoviridae sp. ctZ5d16]